MPVNQHHMEFFNKIKRAFGISNNINDKNNNKLVIHLLTASQSRLYHWRV